MSRGNSNFVPGRLTEAREVRGLTRAALAEMLGVTRQAPSLWEKGDRSPSSDLLEAISRCLRFPMHRFVRPLIDAPTGTPFFRSMATASKSARSRAMRRVAWVRDDICGLLREFVEFTPVNFPIIDVPNDPAELSFGEIEEIATQVRRYWGLGDGPISDLSLLLENNGAIVVRQELGATNLDAFSEWSPLDNRPYIVLGSDKGSAVRSRFDLAHELGHMILHRHIRRGRILLPEIFGLVEDQAHYFAGAFLLPASTFGHELAMTNLEAFRTAKPRWRVSIAAMIRRAANLDLISTSEVERLYAYKSQKGWTRREPFDDEWDPEFPRFIKRSIDLVLHEGLVTRSSLEAATALFVDDIENAVGLERGFLEDDVQHFKMPSLSINQNTYSENDNSLADMFTPNLPFRI